MILYYILGIFFFTGCGQEKNKFNTALDTETYEEQMEENTDIIVGAERTALYLSELQNKSVGLVINHTSRVGNKSLLDTLLSLEVKISGIFAPEHGLKGIADAGEKVEDGKFKGIPVHSLYGKNKKPSQESLTGMDILIFDIQDVGARFYTYISTLHYVMESAAENEIKVLVLDRPNPNGFYVDGPVLEPTLKSFVGMHPVPVIHGMTIGEYAQMINGEAWLANGVKCDLEVIKCKNYDHTMTYDLPVKPSPNLPNLRSVMLYPSLCLFEGTTLSIGRGTNSQFQLIGHPALSEASDFSFTPVSKAGAKFPKHQDKACYGEQMKFTVGELLRAAEFNVEPLIKYHDLLTGKGEAFFNENNFFDKLAGTTELRKQIESGHSVEQIKDSWQDDLATFKAVRIKYLLYADFE